MPDRVPPKAGVQFDPAIDLPGRQPNLELSPEASARFVELMAKADQDRAEIGVSGPSIAQYNVARARSALRTGPCASHYACDCQLNRLERLEAVVRISLEAHTLPESESRWDNWWRAQYLWALGEDE